MPVTFDKLVERVFAEHKSAATPLFDHERTVVESIVRATIHGMGFHIASNGEVSDPRPQPSIVYSGVRQQNVRWRGGRKR